MGRPSTLPDPWNLLAEKLGGVQALADALHSDPRTVGRWANRERTPRGPARAMIDALFLQHHIQAPY